MYSLQELQQKIKDFCHERDWGQYHDPKNLALSLQLEAAEVLELFQWTKDNHVQPGKEGEVAHELADVLYWVLLLADKFDIDLSKAFLAKLALNEEKYPVEKVKGKSKKYTEYEGYE